MNEMLKQIFFRFVLPVLVPVAVGLGSAVLTSWSMTQMLDSRVSSLEMTVESHKPLTGKIEKLETTIERHEKALDRDFLRHEQIVAALASKTDDQEKRLTRLETLVGETQALLTEIRADVKILLRGGQQ